MNRSWSVLALFYLNLQSILVISDNCNKQEFFMQITDQLLTEAKRIFQLNSFNNSHFSAPNPIPYPLHRILVYHFSSFICNFFNKFSCSLVSHIYVVAFMWWWCWWWRGNIHRILYEFWMEILWQFYLCYLIFLCFIRWLVQHTISFAVF